MSTTLIIVAGVVAVFFVIGAMDVIGKALNKCREYLCPKCGEVVALGHSGNE